MNKLQTKVRVSHENKYNTSSSSSSSSTMMDPGRALIQQQDEEYERLLRAHEARLRAEAEEELQTQQQQTERQRQEAERRQQESARQVLQQRKREQLPAEPTETTPSDQLVRVAVVLNDGSRLHRRFLSSHPLSALYLFVETSVPHLQSFHLLSGFPRHILPHSDLSFHEYGIQGSILCYLDIL